MPASPSPLLSQHHSPAHTFFLWAARRLGHLLTNSAGPEPKHPASSPVPEHVKGAATASSNSCSTDSPRRRQHKTPSSRTPSTTSSVITAPASRPSAPLYQVNREARLQAAAAVVLFYYIHPQMNKLGQVTTMRLPCNPRPCIQHCGAPALLPVVSFSIHSASSSRFCSATY